MIEQGWNQAGKCVKCLVLQQGCKIRFCTVSPMFLRQSLFETEFSLKNDVDKIRPRRMRHKTCLMLIVLPLQILDIMAF